MRFVTQEEAKDRARDTLGSDGYPQVPHPGSTVRREEFGESPGYTYFARAKEVVAALGYFEWCLLWVVLTDVWPSNENLHLYYRLRESYGDHHEVQDRPGLVALRHEEVDLVSFVNLGMMFGWEMFLVTSHDCGRALISHDGYFDISTNTSVVSDGGSNEPRPAT